MLKSVVMGWRKKGLDSDPTGLSVSQRVRQKKGDLGTNYQIKIVYRSSIELDENYVFGFPFTTANKVVPLRGKVPATRVKRPVVYSAQLLMGISQVTDS